MNHLFKKAIIIGVIAWVALLLTTSISLFNLEGIVHNSVTKPVQIIIIFLTLLTVVISFLPIVGVLLAFIGYFKHKHLKYFIIGFTLNVLYIVLIVLIFIRAIKIVLSAMISV
ncbi:hypothetical protein GCM10008018_50390 [Paenibacillus marchantiophytorum]|uniref:Uncharacterized protein n=1 Tax=Paenibacillus marchantiophytorum TaxID=1619310 RepID=A0ABQ1F3H9_9BACL|nr:hypothetical protein GCM10008018_50390 [Paenibacillus marchantiophytorum]